MFFRAWRGTEEKIQMIAIAALGCDLYALVTYSRVRDLAFLIPVDFGEGY